MAQRNVLESARHIVVEGPIGVGKTSLARRLASHLEAQTSLEQPELNPFLTRFYQDQARHALPTQLFFLFQRMDQLRDLAQLTLSDDEYELYRQIYERVSPQAPTPDLVIYLQARPETLIARVRKRGIDIERRISDTYLTELAERYSRFFYNYDAAPVMVVNSENLNFVDRDDDFRLLVERIEAMRGQRGYFNRGE